jgi:hypothetical protein
MARSNAGFRQWLFNLIGIGGVTVKGEVRPRVVGAVSTHGIDWHHIQGE